MKVLLLNGSPHEKGCTYTALSEVAAALTADGVEAEILWAGSGPHHGVPGLRRLPQNGVLRPG